MALWCKEVAESEVDDLNISRLAYEYVLNLQISVNNAVPVTIIQRARYLTTELPGLLLLKLTVGNNVVQHLPTVNVFEQHVPVVTRTHDIAHATNVWVVE